MGDGLPKPAVVSTLANRGRQIDAAEAAALNPKTDTNAPEAAPRKPMTVAEAEAKAAKYKAEREAFDREAKGMPKPSGLLDRLFR